MTVYQNFSEEDILQVAKSATRRALREIPNLPYDAVRQHWADMEQEAVMVALEALQRPPRGDVWHIGQLVCYVAIVLRSYIARQLWPDALDKGLAESTDESIDEPGVVNIHSHVDDYCVRRPVENALIRREMGRQEKVSVAQMIQFERQLARILAFVGMQNKIRPNGDRIRTGAHIHARIVLGRTSKEVAEELGLKRQAVRHMQMQDRQKIQAYLALPPEVQAEANDVLYFWDELTEERLHIAKDFYVVTKYGTFLIQYKLADTMPFSIGIRESTRYADGRKTSLRQRLPKPHKLTKATALQAIGQLHQKLAACQRPAVREGYHQALDYTPTRVAAQPYLAMAAD